MELGFDHGSICDNKRDLNRVTFNCHWTIFLLILSKRIWTLKMVTFFCFLLNIYNMVRSRWVSSNNSACNMSGGWSIWWLIWPTIYVVVLTYCTKKEMIYTMACVVPSLTLGGCVCTLVCLSNQSTSTKIKSFVKYILVLIRKKNSRLHFRFP